MRAYDVSGNLLKVQHGLFHLSFHNSLHVIDKEVSSERLSNLPKVSLATDGTQDG